MLVVFKGTNLGRTKYFIREIFEFCGGLCHQGLKGFEKQSAGVVVFVVKCF